MKIELNTKEQISPPDCSSWRMGKPLPYWTIKNPHPLSLEKGKSRRKLTKKLDISCVINP